MVTLFSFMVRVYRSKMFIFLVRICCHIWSINWIIYEIIYNPYMMTDLCCQTTKTNFAKVFLCNLYLLPYMNQERKPRKNQERFWKQIYICSSHLLPFMLHIKFYLQTWFCKPNIIFNKAFICGSYLLLFMIHIWSHV